jgi:hypothetical protein
MAKVVHLFKSRRPIFLFEFLELGNLAFGRNQCWIRLGFEWNFIYTRAHLSASPPPSSSVLSVGVKSPPLALYLEPLPAARPYTPLHGASTLFFFFLTQGRVELRLAHRH